MFMKNPLPLLLAAAMALVGLCSCQSTNPTQGDMDRYYKEAEARADRIISRLGEKRDEGKLSQQEYDEKVQKVRSQIGQQAMEIAWTRHEMVESQMRGLGVPTGDHPVYMPAPTMAGSDTFYRASGSDGGPGYSGQGSGMWHGYQPGSMVDALGAISGVSSNPLTR
jgi:hypothetical protein